VIESRRGELQCDALALAQQPYRRSPSWFVARVDDDWHAWRSGKALDVDSAGGRLANEGKARSYLGAVTRPLRTPDTFPLGFLRLAKFQGARENLLL
jgi:hypothetical protein